MSDLLKQAIADAKAVRATALANAKAALEEAFAPKLQSMLSEKLRQEVEGMEEEGAEVAPVTPAPAPLDAAAPAPAAEVPPPAPAAPMEAAEGEEEMEEARGTEAAGNVDITQHGVSHVTEGEKASDDYKKKTSGHKTEDPGKKMVVDATKLSTAGEPKAAADSHKASDDYKKTTSGHKTDDPQGQGNEMADGAKKAEDQTSNLNVQISSVSRVSGSQILWDNPKHPCLIRKPCYDNLDTETADRRSLVLGCQMHPKTHHATSCLDRKSTRLNSSHRT